jgi:hypothetical protein
MAKRLPKSVKKSLEKSRDCALLAVETYNKPAVKFKSGGYIVLMVIAWTALFHAIMFKQKKKPFYKIGRYFEKKDGDFCYWDLSHCVSKYFGTDSNNAIRKNLEFFIPLRNMIEHKSIPELDADIFSECQALLLNYDKIMEREFGLNFCLRESLSFALQLFPSSKSLNSAVIANPSTKPIVDFIKTFRNSISNEIINSGEYSFKAFLIQVANHKGKNTLPIQFFSYDKLNEDQKKNVDRAVTLIKNKHVQVPISNLNLIKPQKVVNRVQKGLGNPKVQRNGKEKNKFTLHSHTQCWQYYAVRPLNGANKPEITKSEYCIYDQPNNAYLYTEAWVDFLIEEMQDEEKYNALYN